LFASEADLDRIRAALDLERPTVHASLMSQQGASGLSPAKFRDRAADFLADHGAYLLTGLDALIDLPGRWHPAGYAVFTVGHHEVFGTLRLHVWPSGLRRPEARPPGPRDIHDHVLHISSLVVAGTYTDSFFDVTDDDADPGAPDSLHVYSPPPAQSGSEGLMPTGEVVVAEEVDRRSVETGLIHFIPEGPFHVPTVLPDLTCATVSFSSPAVRVGGPKILFASNVGRVHGSRISISAQDRARIKRLVAA
jgi:hypothetical protein